MIDLYYLKCTQENKARANLAKVYKPKINWFRVRETLAGIALLIIFLLCLTADSWGNLIH